MNDSRYIMGIDGGGSTVRVAIFTPQLDLIAESTGSTANPNTVGHETAAYNIQNTIMGTLERAKLTHNQVACVGIGVGGAAPEREGNWLNNLIEEIMPVTIIAISSDYEIALTGAHGEHRGILVLCGTGSLAYGVNSTGETALVGGWGWLLGDEGSGYWIGLQALNAVIRATEKRAQQTTLTNAIFSHLKLTERQEIIKWAYAKSRTRDVATLAPLVLEHATDGDTVAMQIVEKAARELALQCRAVMQQLAMEALPIAFAGSLLTHNNPLSLLLCDLLKIEIILQPKYVPVVGAAIIALNKQH
ncbi:MAG: BadF/BadG/BcrA/BcrD ATPase family protein [Aggregatilineales bacterium]